MLFTTVTFVLFYILVAATYFALAPRYKAQNLVLLLASYVFYGFWDWRFCGLLLASTTVNFVSALIIDSTDHEKRRKLAATFAIVVSLGILGFFKYFNFFADQLAAVLQMFGLGGSHATLKIVLPVGMSFYTFKEISYIIDVYRGKFKAERNPLSFGLYVSFFAQLVAGPIERASQLLPQINAPRRISATDVESAVFLILYGYFLKLVIADNVSPVANQVFDNYHTYRGLDIVLGMVAYALQIYGDFAGYSSIARGIARLLGFHLPINFKLPYFARNPSDFWQRWHVTLSQWLRDYLYISLGGNRKGQFRTSLNLMITMLLGGLWHGAAWNFIAWGGYHGLIQVIHHYFVRPDVPKIKLPDKVATVVSVVIMFGFTIIGWVLFRAHSLDQIVSMISRIGITPSVETKGFVKTVFACAIPLFCIEAYQQSKLDLLPVLNWRTPLRFATYAGLLLAIALLGARQATEFIYFQF
jgi:D-alanyl-lipoteichoic acid acyltransferase DltB (MBOAT superfamily)